MGDVTGIRPGTVLPSADPDAELIEFLRETLAAAESGKIRAIAYAVIERERHLVTGWAGNCDRHDTAAAVAILSHRFHEAMNWSAP
jgi:hypothetical protein